MRRTLYLHIGAHRTGTTSIQRFLRRNTDALAARGVLNPFGLARHYELIGQICGGRIPAAAAAALLEAEAAASEAATGCPVRALVLSDEDICSRTDIARLARLSDHFAVQVIYVIRRQDLWLESWYRQNVKWQWNPDLAHRPFAEFLARRRAFFWIDYEATVTRLERLFGRDAVAVLLFEAPAMPEGPVAAFARAIGLDRLDGLAADQHANASLTALTTEFMRQLPLDEMPERTRRLVEEACRKTDWHVRQHFGPQSALHMDAATRAAVMAGYAPGNAALARRRFGRAALFATPLPPDDAPLAPAALPDDAARLMTVFVAPLLRGLAQDLTRLRAGADAEEAAGESGSGR
jgi:hypothetical protein